MQPSIPRSSVIAAFAALCAWAGYSQAANTNDLDLLLDRHQMSVQAISTFQCAVDVRSPSRSQVGNYWRAGNQVIVKSTDHRKIRSEIRMRDGVVSTIATVQDKASGGTTAGGFQAYDGQELVMCDVWPRALLTVLEPNKARYLPLADLVKQASRVSKPNEEVVDGKNLVAIEMTLEKPGQLKYAWTTKVYLDPAANWMITRTMHSTVASNSKHIDRIAQVRGFKEVVPGLFFPTSAQTSLVEDGGQPSIQLTTSITGLRINEPISDATFHLAYPEGLPVLDRIRKAKYKVNSRGEPITPLVYVETDNASASSSRIAVAPRPPTKSEPKSKVGWFTAAGLGFIGLALAVWLTRTYRGRRDGESNTGI